MLDPLVEKYLVTAIAPIMKYHEKFYNKLNCFLRDLIDSKGSLPKWFTANFITYARTTLIVPCLLLLARGHRLIPAFIVISVDFGDFLDGVVARYWMDLQKKKDDHDNNKKLKNPSQSGFEFTDQGSLTVFPSWATEHRNKSYGGFIDAVCDKAFVVPCWIFLLSSVSGTGILRFVQNKTLFWLILAEIASGCVRFRAFYTAGGIPAPAMKGLDFSTSAVKADHIGKAKQTFEMVGTCLYMLPFVRWIGLLLLMASCPLAYESVRRKVKKRSIYVHLVLEDDSAFNHKTMKFLIQARGLGSKLTVGVSSASPDGDINNKSKTDLTDIILNVCSCSSVNEVIAGAPGKIDQEFMTTHGLDFFVCLPEKQEPASDELLQQQKCLVISEDGTAKPVMLVDMMMGIKED